MTGNAAKFATAQEHLSGLDAELEQVALDLDEIQSESVRMVALHKAQAAFRVLRRPVIVEDSAWYIDQLGFPGPFVKYLVKAVGADGLARLADLTTDRRCHFEGVLVYIDAHGVPRVFSDNGDGGTVALSPTTEPQPGSWSPLWDVFVPTGRTIPLSALDDDARAEVFAGWAKTSVFAQFGGSLARKQAAGIGPVEPGARLRSTTLGFEFPADRIASRPRPAGRDLLLVLDRATEAVAHHQFTDLPALLPPRSLLVVNNSRVVKAALRRTPDDGTYVHVVDPFKPSLDDVLCLCPWKPEVGATVRINGGRFIVEASPEPGRDLRTGRIIPDDSTVTTLTRFMEQCGEVPIPIYVNAQRAPEPADAGYYQNVYASVPGSVACPTAGLHLTKSLIGALNDAGHEVAEVTLHIGYGTWKSLASEFVDEHHMDAEHCEIPDETLRRVREAKGQGRPVVAVGTSSVRTLESFADEILDAEVQRILPRAATLFISGRYPFRIVDHMITNFAYPQTPIMALTAAFTGDPATLFNAYREAVDHNDYQFFTYGDGMFIR